MASQGEPITPTPAPSKATDPVGYWWPVCRGEEIMRAFHDAPEPEAWRVVERHPALLLPEILEAAEQLFGRTRPIDGLREMHQSLRGSIAYPAYHRLLAGALIAEQRGSRRINLERALAVIKDVRRASGDPSDDQNEWAIRTELKALISASNASFMSNGSSLSAAPSPRGGTLLSATSGAGATLISATPGGGATSPSVATAPSAPEASPPSPVPPVLAASSISAVPQVMAAPAISSAKTSAPVAKPPSMLGLFLDDDDLVRFRRGDDRRTINPNLHDRAYQTHGGLASGASEWLGDVAGPVYRILDARWVFASTKAARAYLDSPGTQLLARDGMENPAVLKIGDGAHAWGNERSPSCSRARHCLLFRVERVVAKLDVTEGPGAAQALQRLTRDQILPYAELVVRRVRRVLAEYWLAIGNGTTAAQKLMQASQRTADRLFAEYPILLLPEFPTAMASLGAAYRARAEQLAIMQGAARNNWRSYRELLRTLVRTLCDEPAGEPRINADAALRLVLAHRQLDADPSWATLETECGERAAGKPVVAASPPSPTTPEVEGS